MNKRAKIEKLRESIKKCNEVIFNLENEISEIGTPDWCVPLHNFRTSDGERQWLSRKDGTWFASRWNENLVQEFYEDEIPTEFQVMKIMTLEGLGLRCEDEFRKKNGLVEKQKACLTVPNQFTGRSKVTE